jgi:hypothetical protein
MAQLIVRHSLGNLAIEPPLAEGLDEPVAVGLGELPGRHLQPVFRRKLLGVASPHLIPISIRHVWTP